jgi:hypothetical protein
MTLQVLADKIGIHPYDVTGDKEMADELIEEQADISDTIFYQEMKSICAADPTLGITLP